IRHYVSQMQIGKVYRNDELAIGNVWRADTVLTRARGLLGRPALQADQGLAIVPCHSIHTFGMKYPLDVVFIDSTDRIIKLYHNLPRWRMAMAPRATWTLELYAGEIARLDFL